MLTSDENAAQSGTAAVRPADAVLTPQGPLAGPPRLRRWLSTIAHSPWTYVGVVLVLAAAVIARTDHASPGFDPYGWLVWGYQTMHLNLNLGGAPSWKPVTYLFTVPYSLTGHYSYWLWIVTAVAFALAGPIVAGRLAFRLVHDSTGEVWPAVAGAVFAAAGLLGIYQYTHYWLSAQSDPMLATCFLLAIDMHLSRKPRWALTFLFLCSIGRPETWPFIGLYAIWAWRKVPAMRWMIVAELVLIPGFWFGVPVLSGNYWDIAGKLALHSPRQLPPGQRITGTLTRFRELSYWPIEVPAALGLVWAIVRRDRQVVAVAACTIAWMVIEVGFALHGFPGVPRYMFEAAAAMMVVSGVAIGWLLSEPVRLVRGGGLLGGRGDPGGAPAGPDDRRNLIGARVAGVAVVAVFVGFLIPYLSTQASMESTDLTGQQARTREIARMNAMIGHAGGYKLIRSCGDPTVRVEYVSILAWYTKLNVGVVGHQPLKMIHQPIPVVLFTQLPNGWILHTFHLAPGTQARCANLNGAFWVQTPTHPGGVFGHQHT